MSTHRAVIESSVPPGLTLIAAGSERWCTDRLVDWVNAHPPAQYSTAYVLRVESETITEPGVGVYTVPVGTS
jgi:hypothetical protein